ncbi:hypothetical protein BDV98DRAFT_609897 [Pterulicium gracile]|uniref:Uncharacterized protein n=1 Tax=Pterulicium gracile TaxID=1884261 RepID=A0A5C3QVW7_9AGAR|nr:hypothetical protein BDV98DRAFT_609897 [Pterula gracilis]
MWCDNCLLVLPLRGGAIAWGVVIALYSIAGGMFLLISGQYLFFFFPEWQIYGGIGVGVAACAIINIIALSNRSYIWVRVCKFLWPFIIVLSAVRAIVMLVQLKRGEEHITWQCQNGGQLWTPEAEAASVDRGSMPMAFCTGGAQTLWTVFVVALLVDLVFQVYMLFLNWRFSRRLERYNSMKGPFQGGYYNA